MKKAIQQTAVLIDIENSKTKKNTKLIRSKHSKQEGEDDIKNTTSTSETETFIQSIDNLYENSLKKLEKEKAVKKQSDTNALKKVNDEKTFKKVNDKNAIKKSKKTSVQVETFISDNESKINNNEIYKQKSNKVDSQTQGNLYQESSQSRSRHKQKQHSHHQISATAEVNARKLMETPKQIAFAETQTYIPFDSSNNNSSYPASDVSTLSNSFHSVTMGSYPVRPSKPAVFDFTTMDDDKDDDREDIEQIAKNRSNQLVQDIIIMKRKFKKSPKVNDKEMKLMSDGSRIIKNPLNVDYSTPRTYVDDNLMTPSQPMSTHRFHEFSSHKKIPTSATKNMPSSSSTSRSSSRKGSPRPNAPNTKKAGEPQKDIRFL